MKKTLTLLTLFALLTLTGLAAYAAEPANVAGKWKFTMTSRMGERTYEYTIVQDKEKVTLSWVGREGQEQKAEGTITGNELQWSVTRERPNGTFTMNYKGTVAGDTITGTAETPMGALDWKGERVKAQ